MAGAWLRAQVGILQDAAGELRRGRWPRSYAFTFVAEMGVLLGGFAALKIAGGVLGTTGFGEYAVARRAVSVLAFPLLVGLGISIPRYVARAVGADPSGATARGYFLAALLIGAPILGGFGVVAALERDWFARAFYGDARFSSLTMPIVTAIVGLYAHTLVYANFRGRLRMWPANLLQLVNLALTPPLALLASHRSAAAALEITGVVWLLTATAAGSWGLLRGGGKGGTPERLIPRAVRDLLGFGLPRVAGEFALFGFFALPTFYVAHTSGIETAGFFSFGLSLVQMLTSLFAAIGILLLPYVSRQVAEGSWDRIASIVSRAVTGSLFITVLLVFALQAVLDRLILLLMGSAFAPAVQPARWLITGAIPFVAYTVVRDSLDAVATWPYNSVNVVVALATVTGLLWLGGGVVSPALAVALGCSGLGVLTLLTWGRALRAARASGPRAVTVVPGDSEFGV